MGGAHVVGWTAGRRATVAFGTKLEGDLSFMHVAPEVRKSPDVVVTVATVRTVDALQITTAIDSIL